MNHPANVRPALAPIAKGTDVLSAFETPHWLKDGSLNDNYWRVQLHDPENERRRSINIDFNVAVSPGRRMLTDDDFINDLLTSKILLVKLLDPIGGITTSPGATQHIKTAIFNFIRWRNDQNIHKMSDLTRIFYEDYIDRLDEGGVARLISLEEKIKYLKDHLHLYQFDRINPKTGRPNLSSLMELCGLSNHQKIPPDLLHQLNDLFKDLWPTSFELPAPIQQPKNKKGSFEPIRRSIAVWEYLWNYRDFLEHDQIAFQAIEPGSSIEMATTGIIERTKKTRALPPADRVCHLILEAIKLIVVKFDVLVQFYNELTSNAKYGQPGRNNYSDNHKAIYSALLPLLNDSTVSKHFPFNSSTIDNINYQKLRWSVQTFFGENLIGASAVILSAFLARRPTQLASLKTDALSIGAGGAKIRYAQSKNGSNAKFIPAPATVVTTFELLLNIGNYVDPTQSNWLFCSNNPTNNRRRSLQRLVDPINTFSRAAGAIRENGSPWSAYDLRHFFATVYYYRHKNPSLVALSKFLDHISLETTRYYIHSARSGDRIDWLEEKQANRRRSTADSAVIDFERVRIQFIADTAKDCLDSPQTVGGNGAKAWKRELEELVAVANMNSSVSIDRGSTPTLDEILIEWAKSKWLEPHPEGHSFCKCGTGPADLSSAACLANHPKNSESAPLLHGRSVENATDLVCASCPHNIQFECLRPNWERRLAQSEATGKRDFDPVSREVGMERARQIRAHLARFFDKEAN